MEERISEETHVLHSITSSATAGCLRRNWEKFRDLSQSMVVRKRRVVGWSH